MNIDFITVIREETKAGKIIGVEISVDGRPHRAALAVEDFDKVTSGQVQEILQALANTPYGE